MCFVCGWFPGFFARAISPWLSPRSCIGFLIGKASDWEEWSSKLWDIQSIRNDGSNGTLGSIHEIVQWPLPSGLDGWCIPEMDLDWLLEDGKYFIQEVFMMWTEVVGTARINEGIMLGFMMCLDSWERSATTLVATKMWTLSSSLEVHEVLKMEASEALSVVTLSSVALATVRDYQG